MKKTTLIFFYSLALSAVGQSQHEWQFDKRKLVGYGMFAIAGAAHGLEDAYYADPHVFEKRFGAGKYSFLGSSAWERNYKGNRYRNADGQTNRHKFNGFNTFRDVKHFLGFTQSRSLMLGGSIVFSTKNQKFKHYLIDFIISSAVYSLASQQAYNIRYK